LKGDDLNRIHYDRILP